MENWRLPTFEVASFDTFEVQKGIMKLELREEKITESLRESEMTDIHLVRDYYSGEIILKAKDALGRSWHILCITGAGTIYRCSGIGPTSRWSLNMRGELKIHNLLDADL